MRGLTSFIVIGLALGIAAGTARADYVRITIVSASLDPKKQDGLKGDHQAGAALSQLACYAVPALRAAAGKCAGPDMLIQPVPDSPPDLYARLEIGDHVVQTFPVPGSFEPTWNYPVLVTRDFLQIAEGKAKFVVADAGGAKPHQALAQAEVKPMDLTKPGRKTLKLKGPFKGLTYQVEILKQVEARTYHYKVTGETTIQDLAKAGATSGDSHLVIPVTEGETVEVKAKGKLYVQVPKHPERFCGPEGLPTIERKMKFNEPGFRGCPGCNHGAVIAQIGIRQVFIGAGKTFTAASSGLLVLGVNDMKVTDNKGAYEVDVKVTPPAATEAPPTQQAPALDPRVIEQVIDQHNNEIMACAELAKDPTGAMVLELTISADGSLLGAVISKVDPPALKESAACIRQKALKWRFPRPNGVVVARYPFSFATE